MGKTFSAAPLRALPLEALPLRALPLEQTAANLPPLQINYADAALRKRMSRLSAASGIVAICAMPTTVGAVWFTSEFCPNWSFVAGWTTFLSTHIACLVLGLWANSLIKHLQGKVADVVMAGIGIAVGGACLGLPLLFILGALIMRAW